MNSYNNVKMFVGKSSTSNSKVNSRVNSQQSSAKQTPTKKNGPMTIEKLMEAAKVSPPRTRSSDKYKPVVDSGSMMQKFLNPSQLMGKLS